MSKGKVLNPIRLSDASSPYLEVAKIKVEKKDPEIEKKIHTVQLGNCIHLRRDKQSHESNESLVTINSIKRENHKEQTVNEERTTCDDTSMETEYSKSQETKCVAPVKSSNEILTELFKVFNATPPEELLDNDNSLKKGKHKKHKKEKKKKKKKSKGSIKSDGELIDASESSASTIITKEDDYRSRHKKHKKHKHKQEKSKDCEHVNGKLKTKAKSRDKEIEKEKEKVQVKNKDVESKYFSSYFLNSHKRFPLVDENVDIPIKRRRTSSEDRRLQRDKDKKHNSFYNGFHDSENHRKDAEQVGKVSKESPRCGQIVNEAPKSVAGNNGDVSEISLSDEEDYLQERKYLDEKRRRYSPTDAKGSCRYRSHHKGTSYGRSQRSQSNERGRRYHHHHRSRSHSARRTRSRSRSRDLGIDKKRLLEIARKNAISMFKRGSLPGCAQMSEEVKDKVLLKMRYGGRTVQDLTEFCKKLSNGDDLDDISDLSSDEDSDVDKAGNAKAFNHPFMIKEREPIVMHIRGSVPIFPKTDEQTKAISMQFPVSSGQQHRLTEGWIPVETKDQQQSIAAIQPSVALTMKSMTKNIFAKPVPTQSQQEPAFKAMTSATLDATTKNATTELQPESAAMPTAVDSSSAVAKTNVAAPRPFAPDVPVPSSEPSVFPRNTGDLDVSHIISKRLNAMRRLQENPQDPEALKMMHNSQTEMTSWVSSKHLPGQFLGSTGANVLSARELSAGPQLWARRDQLTSTQPVTGGMGMQMLKKMGWKPGEGLGREKTGSLQPLLLDVKLDKRGLVSEEDNGYQRRPYPFKKRRSTNLLQAQQNLQEKHPVSLLNELTSKRKWTPPLYTLVNEDGPSHSKVFLFSVSINGQTFTPGQGSNTKKDAKVVAARNCLQQMGIIP